MICICTIKTTMKICGAVQVPSYPKSMEQQMRLRTLLAACPFFRGFPAETIEQARAPRLGFLSRENEPECTVFRKASM